MERHEVIEIMRALKLLGMRQAYDDTLQAPPSTNGALKNWWGNFYALNWLKKPPDPFGTKWGLPSSPL